MKRDPASAKPAGRGDQIHRHAMQPPSAAIGPHFPTRIGAGLTRGAADTRPAWIIGPMAPIVDLLWVGEVTGVVVAGDVVVLCWCLSQGRCT